MATTAERARRSVNRYRDKLRARGLRALQIWVPDTRAPGFAEECRRQSLSIAADPAERTLMRELELLQDDTGWTE